MGSLKKNRSIFYKKLQVPLINFLNEGMDPKKLTWAVVFGFIFGIFPVVGVTTILCVIIALTFRLNMAAIQLVNYFVYPLQLLLIVPYMKAGANLFHIEELVPLTNFTKQFSIGDLLSGFTVLTKAFAGALIIWTVIAVVSSFVIYKIIYPIFKRIVNVQNYNPV